MSEAEVASEELGAHFSRVFQTQAPLADHRLGLQGQPKLAAVRAKAHQQTLGDALHVAAVLNRHSGTGLDFKVEKIEVRAEPREIAAPRDRLEAARQLLAGLPMIVDCSPAELATMMLGAPDWETRRTLTGASVTKTPTGVMIDCTGDMLVAPDREQWFAPAGALRAVIPPLSREAWLRKCAESQGVVPPDTEQPLWAPAAKPWAERERLRRQEALRREVDAATAAREATDRAAELADFRQIEADAQAMADARRSRSLLASATRRG